MFFLQIPDQVASLLGNPGGVGVRDAACQMDASGAQFNEEQNVDGFERDPRYPRSLPLYRGKGKP